MPKAVHRLSTTGDSSHRWAVVDISWPVIWQVRRVKLGSEHAIPPVLSCDYADSASNRGFAS